MKNKEFTNKEINDFKRNWGQNQNEITFELNYPCKHSESDDLLMIDFFFIYKKWYPIHSSMYTNKEQKIANYLRSLL
jgi:hypothetical protein